MFAAALATPNITACIAAIVPLHRWKQNIHSSIDRTKIVASAQMYGTKAQRFNRNTAMISKNFYKKVAIKETLQDSQWARRANEWRNCHGSCQTKISKAFQVFLSWRPEHTHMRPMIALLILDSKGNPQPFVLERPNRLRESFQRTWVQISA